MNSKTQDALGMLLTRIGSWTNARWDQHVRNEFDDETADIIIREIAMIATLPHGASKYILPVVRRGRGNWAELDRERTPDGHINNCSLANGEPSDECQMCGGECPDAARFVARRVQP